MKCIVHKPSLNLASQTPDVVHSKQKHSQKFEVETQGLCFGFMKVKTLYVFVRTFESKVLVCIEQGTVKI